MLSKQNVITQRLREVVSAYSGNLFSNRPSIGWLLLLITLNDPFTGLSGLAGLTLALQVNRWVGFTTRDSDDGFLGINSLLTSLGVAYFFPYPGEQWLFFITLLALSALLASYLHVVLNRTFRYYLNLPAFSLPFVIVTALVCFLYNRVTGTPLQVAPHQLLINWYPLLPEWLLFFLNSLGALFFQIYPLGGLVVALVLFLSSRLHFLLAIIGFTSGYFLVHGVISLGDASAGLLGFNFILTAIVLGGSMLIPSWSSLLFAVLAVLTSAILALALEGALYAFAIPPLALPFNATVLLLLYAMRSRVVLKKPILVDFTPGTPEENLDFYQNRILRFYGSGRPQFFLPFSGEWTVTQGVDGAYTHQQEWHHAWDFEVLNDAGKRFERDGLGLEDYFCYNAPVHAPAAGRVVRIVDGIPDNPVGIINTRENWGNLIVIQHAAGLYTMLCHLQQGSILVAEEQYVRHGEVIARCGNSGRSPVPHLHFQAQLTLEPGSPTTPSLLVNYQIRNRVEFHFRGYGIPREDERISTLPVELRLQDIMFMKVGDEMTFQVKTGGRTIHEDWRVTVNLLGVLRVENTPGDQLEFSIHEGVYNMLGYRGGRQSGLYAFSLALGRWPYHAEHALLWKDELPVNLLVPRVTAFLLEPLRPFVNLVKAPVNYSCRITDEGEYLIKGEIEARTVHIRRHYQTEVLVRPGWGVQRIRCKQGAFSLEVERKERTHELSDDITGSGHTDLTVDHNYPY